MKEFTIELTRKVDQVATMKVEGTSRIKAQGVAENEAWLRPDDFVWKTILSETRPKSTIVGESSTGK